MPQPSLLARLASLFPGYRSAPTPAIESQAQRADRIVAATKKAIDSSVRRPRPSSDERIPANYFHGVAGKIWFLPFADSATHDTPEIRAAMRLMRRDAYVKAAWEPQILTVASEDWQCQPSEEGNTEAEEQAEFCTRVVNDYLDGGMPQLVRSIAGPLGSDGFSLSEPVWDVANNGQLENKIIARAVKAKDPEFLRIEGDRYNNIATVQSLRKHEDVYPITDFLYARYMTVFDEPLGQAAFRPSYAAYWMRDTVRKLRIIYHEKKNGGFLVGEYADDEDKPAVERALAAAKSSTWAAIPQGTRFEAIQLSTASEPDYRSFDESLREEIVTGMAFATLQILQGNIPDARGDSSIQKTMADLAPWLIMSIVMEVLNKQFFPRLIDYNFPYPAGGGYPKATFGAVSTDELLQLLQLVEGAQSIGLTPSKKYYAKALSIQQADPNDPDDSLTPPSAGGFGYGGGMGGGMPPGGGGGGDPFALPSGPSAPPGGGGASSPFSDRQAFHAFAWSDWKQEGDRMVSPSGKRKLTIEGFNRLRGLTRKQTLPYAPQPSKTVSLPVPPPDRPSDPGIGVSAPTPRRIVRGAKATGRHASALAKLVWRGAAKVQQATAYLTQHTTGGVAKIGHAMRSFTWLERNTGIGKAIEQDATRKMRRAMAIKAAARHGGVVAGWKVGAKEAAKIAAARWRVNRKKFGTIGAGAIEAIYYGLLVAKKAMKLADAKTFGLGGVVLSPVFAALGSFFGPIARKTLTGIADLGVSRQRNPLSTLRIAQTLTNIKGGKLPRANDPVREGVRWVREVERAKAQGRMPQLTAEQVHVAEKALAIHKAAAAAKSGATEDDNDPLDFSNKAMGYAYSESFADDVPTADPLDVVTTIREMVEEADPEESLDLTDDQIAGIVSAAAEWLNERAAQHFSDHGSYETFGWEASRTRSGSVKAVGTAEHQGKTLYGANAKAALARDTGSNSRQTAPRDVKYTKTDEAGNTTQVREKGVSPERARAMAIASKVQTADGGSEIGNVKVLKARKAKEKAVKEQVEATAQAALAGDPAAHKALADHGGVVVAGAAAGLAKQPAVDPQAVTEHWNASAGELPPAAARELGGLVGGLATERQPAKVRSIVGHIAAWIGRQTAAVAGGAVKALGRFAWAIAKTAGTNLAREANDALARGSNNVKAAGSAIVTGAKKILGPAAWYIGGAALGAAFLAAPVLAVNAGLMGGLIGLLTAPAWVGAAMLTVRHASRQGSRLVGQNFYGYRPEKYDLKPTGDIFPGELNPKPQAAAFSEIHRFSWSDWKQQGDRWVSPSGKRTLTDAGYRKLSSASKAKQPAKPVRAPAPESSPGPFGHVSAEDEYRHHGSVIRVSGKQIAGVVRPDETHEGHVQRVLNGGLLVEYAPAWAKGGETFRVPASQVEVKKLHDRNAPPPVFTGTPDEIMAQGKAWGQERYGREKLDAYNAHIHGVAALMTAQGHPVSPWSLTRWHNPLSGMPENATAEQIGKAMESIADPRNREQPWEIRELARGGLGDSQYKFNPSVALQSRLDTFKIGPAAKIEEFAKAWRERAADIRAIKPDSQIPGLLERDAGAAESLLRTRIRESEEMIRSAQAQENKEAEAEKQSRVFQPVGDFKPQRTLTLGLIKELKSRITHTRSFLKTAADTGHATNGQWLVTLGKKEHEAVKAAAAKAADPNGENDLREGLKESQVEGILNTPHDPEPAAVVGIRKDPKDASNKSPHILVRAEGGKSAVMDAKNYGVIHARYPNATIHLPKNKDGPLVFKVGGAVTNHPVGVVMPLRLDEGEYHVAAHSHSEHFSDAPTDDEVALAGADGKRAVELLAAAKQHGTDLMASITKQAVERLLASGNPLGAPVLYDDAELEQLRDSLAATIATADLLGRARIRERARQAEANAVVKKFAEAPDAFEAFGDPIPAHPPAKAVEYFQKLVPTLGGGVERYGPLLDRHAFTLAAAADQTVLEKVKQAIATRLRGEAPTQLATGDIAGILADAGVSPKNPQYPEMVYRTNMMDSYNQGSAHELAEPDMQAMFPCWQYLGIRDGRQGKDHEPKFDRYYPSTASFGEVRGPRIWNCRCSMRAVSKYEMDGVNVETRW